MLFFSKNIFYFPFHSIRFHFYAFLFRMFHCLSLLFVIFMLSLFYILRIAILKIKNRTLKFSSACSKPVDNFFPPDTKIVFLFFKICKSKFNILFLFIFALL